MKVLIGSQEFSSDLAGKMMVENGGSDMEVPVREDIRVIERSDERKWKRKAVSELAKKEIRWSEMCGGERC